MKRFFVNVNAIINDNIIISDNEHHHLSKVLRLKIGYKIIVCSGDGYDYYCIIEEITNNSTKCKIEDKVLNTNEPKFDLVLYQSIIKEDNFKLVVKKAVEIGATKIIPVISEFVDKRKFKLDKMQKIAIEACKQCRRAKIIEINDPIYFDEAIKDCKLYENNLVAYENEDKTTINEIFGKINNPKSFSVFIGPEGGYSDKEVVILKENLKSFTLGRRILRAETASLLALGLIINKFDI